MKCFSIRDIERFSDIKAHTLRTWEQRYGMPNPYRNRGNLRYYGLEELNEILNVAILNKNGEKISSLISLTPFQIEEKLKHTLSQDIKKQIAIKDLLMKMYLIDVDEFEAVLDKCFICWTIPEVINSVIFPFVHKVELFWQGHQEIEEHFVVTALRKKLLWAIEKTEALDKQNRMVVLFLCGTKQLDLALLHMYFSLKAKGVIVLYMGNDVSYSNLEWIFKNIRPKFLYTYFSRKDSHQFSKLALLLKQYSMDAKLIITIRPVPEYFYKEEGNIIQTSYDKALALLTNLPLNE